LDDADRQRLTDIVEHAAELAGYLDGVDLERFRSDRMLRRIAERLLEICGEAANHVSEETREAIPADWRGLRRLRVLLAHAYPRVDAETLWPSATRSLPALAAAVRAHLQ
jgi:uncharacterized protein with HEPN domain